MNTGAQAIFAPVPFVLRSNFSLALLRLRVRHRTNQNESFLTLYSRLCTSPYRPLYGDDKHYPYLAPSYKQQKTPSPKEGWGFSESRESARFTLREQDFDGRRNQRVRREEAFIKNTELLIFAVRDYLVARIFCDCQDNPVCSPNESHNV